MIQQNEEKTVRDQLSQIHRLTKKLGQGGQGVVYQTSDPQLLIKMPLKNSKEIENKDEIESFNMQLEKLFLLPISERMHITKPLYLLENRAGYVMQMMQDMQPIGEWLPQIFKKNDKNDASVKPTWFPNWISKDVSLESAYPLAMYANSGGTKRRLELLAQAAIELLKLHSVGLVYMDISPENIFCSKNIGFNEAWLIDADNLRFEVIDAKSAALTPQYAAPEIVKRESGARVLSDSYSLALLAFKIITMSGAYHGKRFVENNNEEDDWASEDNDTNNLSLEVQAEQGLLPFIFDDVDDTNGQVEGLPQQLVLTPELLLYFQKMFGVGKLSPWERPSLYFLPKLLAKAADNSISCECGMSYFFSVQVSSQVCPYCEKINPKTIVVDSYHYTEGQLKDRVWRWVSNFDGKSNLTIPRRLIGRFEIDRHKEPLLEIACIENDFFIYVASDDVKVNIVRTDGTYTLLVNNWLLESTELNNGVQLFIHQPYSVIIEIKVETHNEI